MKNRLLANIQRFFNCFLGKALLQQYQSTINLRYCKVKTLKNFQFLQVI